MKLIKSLKALRGICWVQRIVRRLSAWAWDEMLFDVGRVEWKYGRYDDGTPKNWTEWNNVRAHLREAGKLRQPQELEYGGACKICLSGIAKQNTQDK